MIKKNHFKMNVEAGKDGSRQMGLDDILVEVGEFGRYQIFTLMLIMLPVFFSGLCCDEYIFTAARIPTRCRVPQCDGPDAEFNPPWLQNAIPSASIKDINSCQMFANSTEDLQIVPGTCPTSMFNRSYIISCDQHVYENKNSLVYDFDLGCDEWSRTFIGSVRSMAMVLGLVITGYISDRWGRRIALGFNTFNSAWVSIARSFINSYDWYLVLQVLESTLASGLLSSAYVLVTELMGPRYRVAGGAIIFSVFSLGRAALGVYAWGIQNWRTLTRVLNAPQSLVIIYIWMLSESVRWLLNKGYYKKAENILSKVARINRKSASEQSLEALKSHIEDKKLAVKSKEPWLIILVFQSKEILRRCCISPIWWITNTLILYGMSINSVELIGLNPYLNYGLVNFIEIPGFWASFFLLDRFGRKPVLIFAYSLTALCEFVFIFLPKDMAVLSLALYLVDKCCSALLTFTTYLYTSELYPTRYRQSLLGFSSMVGRLGAIVAPITPALAHMIWRPFPSVLFRCCALLSGMLVFLTPETRGTKLPDTIEEAEKLSKCSSLIK